MMRHGRTIPPSAPPLRLRDILRGFRAIVAPRREANSFASDLRKYYGVRYALLVSSGKAALTVILRSLRALSGRRKVIVPAYTCFSVPASVLKADLELVVCDVDPETLDFDFAQLEHLVDGETLGIVATHLLGLSCRLAKVQSIARRAGAFVIEDAAQAMGGLLDGQSIGALADVGFFSLGRGKTITCGAGGIILTNSTMIGEALSHEVASLRPEPRLSSAACLLRLLLMRCLVHPSLYWIPDGMPFLGLGRTIFPRDFPIHLLSDAAAAVLLHWRVLLTEANAAHRTNARILSETLRNVGWSLGIPPTQDIPYLRLPAILATKEIKTALCRFSKQHGLGISALYPTSINAIPEISHLIAAHAFPGATTLAERLITFPVHRLVRPDDYQRILLGLSVCLSPAGGMRVIGPQPLPIHPAPSA